MFQTPDYTILDHLAAMCAVVDRNLRYVYVNKAVAQHEQLSREAMLGHTLLELNPTKETELLAHVKECLSTHKSVEFEEPSSRWKIKIEPVAEGAFIHWIRITAPKTKVKVKNNTQGISFTTDRGYLQHLSQSMDMELDGWLDSLDMRTKETNEHILGVTNATVTLARLAGIPESEIGCIRHGALLHDIGKIAIPDRILMKSNKLTAEEWDVVRKHPIYGYDLVYPVEYLRDCLSIPYSHHERWDGTGYPQGLKGEQIPLPARLFAVIDVWDTLSSDRIYGKAWPQEKIMDYIRQQSGSQFDPDVVDLFFRARKDFISFDLL
jgi:HD-GYP domain-containing protein (c-di-GMP phosphodiesterase class II)